MLKFWRTVIPLLAVILSSGLNVKAQPNVTVPKTAKPAKPTTNPAKAAQATYVARVNTIANELKPKMSELWGLIEQIEAVYGSTTGRKKGPLSAEKEQQLAKLRTSLVEAIRDIKVNTKRIRSLTPVPRSLRKADLRLVDFSFEMEQGLESLTTWVDDPTYEMSLQLGRQLRKASTTFYAALLQIEQHTDPGVKGKVYVDD